MELEKVLRNCHSACDRLSAVALIHPCSKRHTKHALIVTKKGHVSSTCHREPKGEPASTEPEKGLFSVWRSHGKWNANTKASPRRTPSIRTRRLAPNIYSHLPTLALERGGFCGVYSRSTGFNRLQDSGLLMTTRVIWRGRACRSHSETLEPNHS